MDRRSLIVVLLAIILLAVIAIPFVLKYYGYNPLASTTTSTGTPTNTGGSTTTQSGQAVTSFEECAAQGYPIAESFPRQCRTPQGQVFVENTGDGNLESTTTIRVTAPTAGASVKSPLSVRGQARGSWYFEGTFPVRLLDRNGRELARTTARAQGEWTTSNFVPFAATLTFPSTASGSGTLILEKDNPSGLPQNAGQTSIPIRFSASGTTTSQLPCRATGCSSQICSDREVITTCEFRPEYACYRQATCERQASGACGWTQTAALQTCLSNISTSTSTSTPQ